MEILEGLLFSILWASATVATKFAVRSVDPFLLTCIRFITVAILLHLYTLLFKRKETRLPTVREFKQLFMLGLLNVAIYMVGFLIAIKTVSAGLISIATATNPLILILLSALVLKRKLTSFEWIGISIALTGLIIAAIPNLRDSHSTLTGLIALIIGITSLSSGSVYFSKSKIALPKMAVNMWQITIGGLLFIPIVLVNGGNNFIHTNLNFYLSFLWLVIPVSIVAYALWLNLLHRDTVKAGIWLFLTPAIGYLIAVIVLNEKVTIYGITGSVLVVSGLLYSKRTKKVAVLESNG